MGSMACRPRVVRSGFNLIELLVVIMIITALVSLVLASLSSARRAAMRTTCASNMRQLGQAMQMYANEYRGWILRNASDPGHAPATHQSWLIMLKPRDWVHISGLALAEEAAREKVLKCPAHPYPDISTHFVVNAIAVDDSLPVGSYKGAGATRLTQIRRPSSVVFLTERSDTGFSWGDPPEHEWESNRIVNIWQADVMHESDLPGVPRPVILGSARRVASDRHGPNWINVCYFDGSVQTVGARELQRIDFDDGIPIDRRLLPYLVQY